MDMETACLKEEYTQLEDSISMVNVVWVEEMDDDINNGDVMGWPKTQESAMPRSSTFWESHHGKV